MIEPGSGPRAELLSIGSELLAGETLDTNAAFLGGELARLGVPLSRVTVLPDDRATIADAFRGGMDRSDLVITTGGLGPTHDDLTREGLADALGEALEPDADLEATLRARYAAFGRMPESNLRQAMRIASAVALPNPIGSAPGWWVAAVGGSFVALMPGVPSEMRRMWSEQVVPRLAARLPLRPVSVRAVKTFGIGESAVAERVGDLLEAPGAGVESGIYARDDGVHLRFFTRGDPALLDAPVVRAVAILGDAVWGTDADELAGVALVALRRAGAESVASRETGTGGTLAGVLAAAVAVPGAARFVGGVVVAAGDGAASPWSTADAVLEVALLPTDASGRSRVRVGVTGAVNLPQVEVRIFGTGTQRLRRAAAAALDQVRRSLAG